MAILKITNASIANNAVDTAKIADDAITTAKTDFYSAGTWTPVFADAGSGGNTSSTTADSAQYVKVGGIVTVNFRMTNINTSGLTTSNVAYIQGLPYTPNSEGVGIIWSQSLNTNSGIIQVVSKIFNNFDYIRFEQVEDNGNDASTLVSHFSSPYADLTVTITYTTDE